jgi:sialate O-acetylesterase
LALIQMHKSTNLMKRLIFLFLAFPLLSFAETTLPRFFSNGMVLQQSTEVSVWGTDKPGTTVRIVASWSQAGQVKTDQSGRWKLKIVTPKAGGPYKLSVSGSSTQNIDNIMIGEVWFCSGQSNMEMPLKGRVSQPVEGSNELILNSDNKNIRVFSIAKNSSKKPLDNVEGSWISASPESAGNFSAVAYLYGKKLNQMLKVPIGLIVSSWGGSAIESWMDAQSLAAYPDMNNHKSIDEKFPNRTANLLYNAMVNPVAGYGIKGMLWYQGENNVSDGLSYKDYLSAMIRSWRTVWNLGDFPFYFVQIAPFDYKTLESGYLRDAQLRVMKESPNTGMAVTLDLGTCKLIHPPKKKEVADRLAYWALAKTYGIRGLEYSGPVYTGITAIDSNKLTVKFDHADNGIYLSKSNISGFEVAGADKVFYPAKAVVKKGTQLVVWSDQVKSPVALRYGFSNCAEAILYNTAELPASTFRTDS